MYLDPLDLVGVSFFIASMALLASTVFFVLERGDVPAAWRTSLSVAALVTGIAFVHYMYMREVWIETQTSPTVFRYIDWFITVPLQIIEFYCILQAVGYRSVALFLKLLIASTLMLGFGYVGELGVMNATLGFVLGTLAWLYILYELFVGEVKLAQTQANKPSCDYALEGLKWIVTVGWAIYPLGYVLGYLTTTVDVGTLNVVYNLADFVNKIAFGLIVWAAARMGAPEGEK